MYEIVYKILLLAGVLIGLDIKIRNNQNSVYNFIGSVLFGICLLTLTNSN